MKLLIVEDEIDLQVALKRGFEKLKYTVSVASDGEEAADLYFANTYDLIILDLNLPKLDGLEVLKIIRAENKLIPIIILSARSDVENKIVGLDLGANDYLAKPFHFKELDARIRALLRRNFKTTDVEISFKVGKLDTLSKKFYLDEKEIYLSKKEYAILEYLSLRKGETISAMELIDHIWEHDDDELLKSFKVHLSNLRKKLPSDFIKNSRGHGYYVE